MHRNVTILYWFKWFYWTTSLSCDGTPTPPPASSSRTVFYTLCPLRAMGLWGFGLCQEFENICHDKPCRVCVCVWERERVSNTFWNSAEICVAIRKLAKTGDLGRPACGDFGCYCVLDAFYPLMFLTTARPFFVLITCVRVCGYCMYVCSCLQLLFILVSTATGDMLCGCRCVCLVRTGRNETSCEKEREREGERETEGVRERGTQ